MKIHTLILGAVIVLTTPAIAQHSHGAKGPNGGVMEDVAGVHAELIASGNTITFNILDENNKPIPTKSYSGSVLVVNGSERETVALAPAAENALKGETKKPIATKSSITLMIKTDKGKSGQARFTR
jgi:hypothetical protein